eukprot:4241946-Karenia_brevis.AAC.1
MDRRSVTNEAKWPESGQVLAVCALLISLQFSGQTHMLQMSKTTPPAESDPHVSATEDSRQPD